MLEVLQYPYYEVHSSIYFGEGNEFMKYPVYSTKTICRNEYELKDYMNKINNVHSKLSGTGTHVKTETMRIDGPAPSKYIPREEVLEIIDKVPTTTTPAATITYTKPFSNTEKVNINDASGSDNIAWYFADNSTLNSNGF